MTSTTASRPATSRRSPGWRAIASGLTVTAGPPPAGGRGARSADDGWRWDHRGDGRRRRRSSSWGAGQHPSSMPCSRRWARARRFRPPRLMSPTPAASGSRAPSSAPQTSRCAAQISSRPSRGTHLHVPAGVLAGPATAETGLTPAFLALGEVLGERAPQSSLALSGCRSVRRNRRPEPCSSRPRSKRTIRTLVQVIVEPEDGSWSSRTGVCNPVLVFDGAPSDPWRLDGSVPGAGTPTNRRSASSRNHHCASTGPSRPKWRRSPHRWSWRGMTGSALASRSSTCRRTASPDRRPTTPRP